MRPIFEHITFGTFTAIVMGVILCCLACVVVTLSCCKKRLLRRTPNLITGTPYVIPDRNCRTGNHYTAVAVTPPPPRYEDLFLYFDSPPPYEQPPTLLALSQSKLSSREDLFLQSSTSLCSNPKEDPKPV